MSDYKMVDEYVDVTFDYDSEFSEDEDYDYNEHLDTRQDARKDIHVDLWSEEEFEEDDDESEPDESKEEYLKSLKRQNDILMISGLNLEGKLNWCDTSSTQQIEAEEIRVEKIKKDRPKFAQLSKKQFTNATQQNSPVLLLHMGRTSWDVKRNNEPVFTGGQSITFRSNCGYFQQYGKCQFGAKCIFFHPNTPTHSKEKCKFFTQYGHCKYGNDCRFLHPVEQSVQQANKPVAGKAIQQEDTIQQVDKPQDKLPSVDKTSQCPAGSKCTNKQCCLFHSHRHRSPRHKSNTATRDNFCKHGISCNRMDTCKFIHHAETMVKQFDQHVHQEREREIKKMWLCKKQFQITKDAIATKNECRFGLKCLFAHSKEEVLQMVEQCKNGETCKHVSLVFKQDEQGKKIRRYDVVQNKKCFRIHPKERVIDYIKRTQV